MYNICVYTICLNDEKFIDNFIKTINGLDLFVLDLGSTDNSVQKLKKYGANVSVKRIEPFRYDIIRNESLKLVPYYYDICICLDLNEIISDNYISVIEKLWKINTTKLKYIYNYKFDKNNNILINFYSDRIHLRKDYKWMNPINEVLICDTKENYITTNEITITNIEPKIIKNKLHLLEIAVKERPYSGRNIQELAKEYMNIKQYNKSIDLFINHLYIKSNEIDRSNSMRYIGRCYKKLRRYIEAKMWLKKSIKECPKIRDPYIEIALLEFELKNYNNVISNCLEALKIENKNLDYINEEFIYNKFIYDLLSVAYFYNNEFENSIKYVELALIYDEEDKRLNLNKKIIINKYKNSLN